MEKAITEEEGKVLAVAVTFVDKYSFQVFIIKHNVYVSFVVGFKTELSWFQVATAEDISNFPSTVFFFPRVYGTGK
jgi:hypothetical protein